MFSIIFNTLLCIVVVIVYVVVVALIILIERKFLAVSQRRIGPIMLGKRGILQIVADVVKPLFKEIFEQKIQTVTTLAANVFLLFFTQLLLAMLFSFSTVSSVYLILDLALIIQFCCSSLTCLAVLFLGMLSGSKYAAMGAIRLIISEVSSDLSAFIVQILILEVCSGVSISALCLAQTTYTMFQYLGVFYSIVQLFQTFVAAQRSPLDLVEVEG